MIQSFLTLSRKLGTTKIFAALLVFVALFFSILQELKAAPMDPNDNNLYAFSGEMRNFIEQTKALLANNEASDATTKAALQEMSNTSKRAAHAYFLESDPEIHALLDKYLATQLKNNPDCQTHFILMGNAFIEEAKIMIEQTRSDARTFKIRSAVVGSIFGVVIGGGYLVIKAQYLNSAITGTDWAMAATAVLGFGGAGYAYGAYKAYQLPADPTVKTVTDFMNKYPKGQNFVDDLQKIPTDLRLGLLDAVNSSEAFR